MSCSCTRGVAATEAIPRRPPTWSKMARRPGGHPHLCGMGGHQEVVHVNIVAHGLIEQPMPFGSSHLGIGNSMHGRSCGPYSNFGASHIWRFLSILGSHPHFEPPFLEKKTSPDYGKGLHSLVVPWALWEAIISHLLPLGGDGTGHSPRKCPTGAAIQLGGS